MKIEFPEKYTKIIDRLLSQLGYELNQSSALAKAVLELSDLYNSRQIPQNIWQKQKWAAAYLVYFFPLNYLRSTRSLQLSQQVGFAQDVTEWWEIGSGCGSSFFAYLDNTKKQPLKKAHFLESSPQANQIMQQIWHELQVGHYIKASWIEPLPPPIDKKENHIFVASYSLNELAQLPSWVYEFKNLLFIEPSLQEESRQLMNLRQHLLSKDFSIWAPCTHQGACPLLTHSRTDWCFDRFFIEMPSWFLEIEKHLPMKNRSLTYSYLATSKLPPPSLQEYGRIIGDTLKEKGKFRQAYCRNSDREFLAWLKKEGEPPSLPRGHLLKLESHEKKGNELRVQEYQLELNQI